MCLTFATFVRVDSVGAQTIELVSVASDGTPANGASLDPALSRDGRFVAFRSDATNLVPGDTNGVADIFVRDRVTGTTTRESVGPGGVQSNGISFGPKISDDGRFVAFVSLATNLVPGVSGAIARQSYVRDRQAGVTYAVSFSTAGSSANANAAVTAMSADGRYVVFDSDATNLVANDTNAAFDVFTRDRSADVTTRESVNADGTQFPVTGQFGSSYHSALSGDGRFLAFTTNAGNFGLGNTTVIVVRDRSTGRMTLESIDDSGRPVPFSDYAQISDDGRYVTFVAPTLSPGDGYIYLRDRTTTRSISLKPCSDRCLWYPGEAGATLSPDGRFISTVVLRGACNGVSACSATVEVLDQATGQFIEVPVATTGANALSQATRITGSEHAFAVATLERFVPADTNGVADIYLVRLNATNAPDAPSGLTAAATGSTVTLTWNAPTSGGTVSEYVIEAGSSHAASDLAHFSTGNASTTFSQSGVRVGTYYVRIKATNASGTSVPSNEAILTVTSGGCSSPAPPASLTASVSGSAVTLGWTAGAGATSYIVDVGSGPGLSDRLVTDLRSSATTLAANGVAPGAYYVRVRSTNACGPSSPSNEILVTVASQR